MTDSIPNKMTFRIDTQERKQKAVDWVRELPLTGKYEVIIREHVSRRSLEQNARMWAMLRDVSSQVDWYGNRLTPEEWKDVFTAALKRLRIVPGIDGGFVSIGGHTSTMSMRDMSDMIELIAVFAGEHNVRFSAPEWMVI